MICFRSERSCDKAEQLAGRPTAGAPVRCLRHQVHNGEVEPVSWILPTGTPIFHPGESPLLDVPGSRYHVLLNRALCSGVGRAGRHGVRVTGPHVFLSEFVLSTRPCLMPTSFGARDSGLRVDRVFRHGRRRGRIPVVSGFEFGVGSRKCNPPPYRRPGLWPPFSRNAR